MGESEKSNWFLEITLLTVVAGIFVAIAIPNYCGSPRSGPGWDANVCINNLRQIDGAINEWALEKGKTNGTVVVENEIKAFIKLGPDGQLPKCPLGGKYVIGKIGIYPQVTCSLGTNVFPAHVLP